MKLYEIYQDSKRYYLVMESMMGGELYDSLTARNNYEEELASHIIS